MKLYILMILAKSTIIEDVLLSWKDVATHFYILVNNSDQSTIDTLNKLKKKLPLTYILSNFTTFADTRNRCINMAPSNGYSIMIDDTYILNNGNYLLKQLKGSNSYFINIHFENYSYPRALIFKNGLGIHFIGDIHEQLSVYPNVAIHGSFIEDIPTVENKERTQERFNYELEALKKQGTTDSLYHIFGLYLRNDCEYELIKEAYDKRMEVDEFHEQIFFCKLLFANYLISKELIKQAILVLIEATRVFQPRQHEAYYSLFLITEHLYFLYKAYHTIPIIRNFNMPYNRSIITKICSQALKFNCIS